MKSRWRIVIAILILSLQEISLAAQLIDTDTSYTSVARDSVAAYYRRNPPVVKSGKSMEIVPLYGIGYCQEDGVVFMGGFSSKYDFIPDTHIPLSSLDIVASISTTLAGSLSVDGTNILGRGNMYTEYAVSYNYNKQSFWGLGFDNWINDANEGDYSEHRIKGRWDLLYRKRSLILAGGFIGYDMALTSKFTRPEMIAGNPLRTQYISVGVRFDLDTRGLSSREGRGIYLNIEHAYHIPVYYKTSSFQTTAVVADFYLPAWKGALFAIDLYGVVNWGDAPWTHWPQVGGGERMRGYYSGRIKEKNILSAQLEYRQHIYGAHGIVLWGGAGLPFSSFAGMDIKNTLPTFGAGYRLTLFGVMLRVDAGFGSNSQYSITAGINHAF